MARATRATTAPLPALAVPGGPIPDPPAQRWWAPRHLLLLGTILGVFLLFLAAFADTIGGVGRPFGGFTCSAAFTVSENPAPGAPALGGPRPGDHLALLDGRPPDEMAAVFAAAAAAGRPIAYTVLRAGAGGELAPVQVSGGTTPFRVTNWLASYGAGFLLAFVWWALGTFLYAVGPARLLHRIFLGVSLLISSLILTDITGTYTYQVTPLETALFAPLFSLLMPICGATLLRLAFLFPLPKRLAFAHQPAQYWPYLVAVLLGGANCIDTYRRVHALPVTATAAYDTLSLILDRGALLYAVLGTFGLIGGIVYDGWRARDPVVRRQVRLVGTGMALGGTPLVFGELLPIALGQPPLITGSQGYLFFIIAPLALAYALVRYRLFDVSRVLQVGAVYLAASSLLLAVYFVLVSGLQVLLRELTGQNSAVVAFVSTLGIAVLLAPLITRAQHGAERVLFRERFMLRQALRDFGARVATFYELEPLAGALVDETSRLLRVRAAALLLCRTTPDGAWLELLRARGDLLPADAPRIAAPPDWLAATIRHPAALDLDLPGPRAAAGSQWEPLHAAGVGVVLPLVAGGDLVGVLLLGRKSRQAGFLREELDVLDAIAGQAALAVRNAQLLVERAGQERLRSELEIARTIQRNLLPAQVPVLPGLEIAADCLPAQETSGDSYDLIVDERGMLHIVVSDACGKGIPAALLIALSRNTLRGALAHTAHPAQALTETNRILVPDLARYQFLAASCLTIDPHSLQLCLANAGQMYPLLARPGAPGRPPTCEFLETPAPGLPLGLVADLVYGELPGALRRGDLLVCYSDGLVDSSNPAGEPFGFDRLAALLETAVGTAQPAAAILRALLGAATAWAAPAAPQDDITLVVVRVL